MSSKAEFSIELTTVITHVTTFKADPKVGILEGGIEEIEFELRDGDDNEVKIAGMDEYIHDNFEDELYQTALEKLKEDEEDYAAASCDYFEGLEEERKLA